MAREKFDIGDAFQSDEEDPIRLYGATNASAPIKSKIRPSDHLDDKEPTQETSDSHAVLLSSRPQVDVYREARMGSVHSLNSEYSDAISVSTKTFPEEKGWWHHPKVRQNWKIVLASFVLLILGIVLLFIGIVIEITGVKKVQSFVFFIAGAICLIPGAYHVVYIYCAVKGRRGFSFYNMPQFK